MNLRKKKILAAKTLNVGKGKIIFIKTRLDEIKEAITKQDIKDLHKEGAIVIRESSGRRKVIKRRNRSPGNVRIKVNKRKQNYMILTRKLRKYVGEMKKQRKLSNDKTKDIKKKIKNKFFKNQAHLKEYIKVLK